LNCSFGLINGLLFQSFVCSVTRLTWRRCFMWAHGGWVWSRLWPVFYASMLRSRVILEAAVSIDLVYAL